MFKRKLAVWSGRAFSLGSKVTTSDNFCTDLKMVFQTNFYVSCWLLATKQIPKLRLRIYQIKSFILLAVIRRSVERVCGAYLHVIAPG